MCKHYATYVNDSGLEDAYYCNLDRVYTWIQSLEKPRDSEPRSSAPDLTGESIEGQDFVPDLDSRMIEALATIRLMLDLEPPERPPAQGLWENFQHVSSQMCRDCDPRLPNDIWTPNRRQKDAMESGASRRRSMQLIPEEAPDKPSNETRVGELGNNLLSANYRSDGRSRRASSPHTGRKQAYLNRPYSYAPTEPYGLGDRGPPVQDDTQMRTSSATDGRRADMHGYLTASRSLSPRQRRPYSESRLQYGPPQTQNASVHALPRNINQISNVPPVSRFERVPVAQNSTVSAHSLGAKAQSSASDILRAHERPGLSGHLSQQKQEYLQPGTQIIIYDFLEKQAYVTAYAHLSGNRTPSLSLHGLH